MSLEQKPCRIMHVKITRCCTHQQTLQRASTKKTYSIPPTAKHFDSLLKWNLCLTFWETTQIICQKCYCCVCLLQLTPKPIMRSTQRVTGNQHSSSWLCHCALISTQMNSLRSLVPAWGSFYWESTVWYLSDIADCSSEVTCMDLWK